LVEFVIV